MDEDTTPTHPSTRPFRPLRRLVLVVTGVAAVIELFDDAVVELFEDEPDPATA
jgi:hypothetical protein